MLFERISGPHQGYYIASYACQMGELGDVHLGQYKVFDHRPRGYFDLDCVCAGSAGSLAAQPEAALRYAEARAAEEIALLSTDAVPAHGEHEAA